MTLNKTQERISADWSDFQSNPVYKDVTAAAKTGVLTEQALFAAFCAGFNAGTRSLTDVVSASLSSVVKTVGNATEG